MGELLYKRLARMALRQDLNYKSKSPMHLGMDGHSRQGETAGETAKTLRWRLMACWGSSEKASVDWGLMSRKRMKRK